MYCIYCGSKIEAHTSYCNNCGKFIANTVTDDNQKPTQVIPEAGSKQRNDIRGYNIENTDKPNAKSHRANGGLIIIVLLAISAFLPWAGTTLLGSEKSLTLFPIVFAEFEEPDSDTALLLAILMAISLLISVLTALIDIFSGNETKKSSRGIYMSFGLIVTAVADIALCSHVTNMLFFTNITAGIGCYLCLGIGVTSLIMTLAKGGSL